MLIQEYMADAGVPAIDALGVDAVELPHARRQIARGGFDEQMVVVIHQAVGVTQPGETRDHLPQGVQEEFAVGRIAKNRLACIAAGGDVVKRTGKLDSQWAGHD